MSIKSWFGNFGNKIQNTIGNLLNTAKTQMQNIVSQTKTGFSNLWSGGFTGMNESGIAELKNQLTIYCKEVQEIIDGFDQTGDISSALKGDIQTAAYDYIDAIKQLFQAYVSTMKQELAEIDDAYNNFMAAGKQISQDVQNDASDIRSNANSISLD